MLKASQFIINFENANIKKGVKIRKGYAKISKSIEMSVLSTDAFKLYSKLLALSEKVKVSDVYLREFIRNERDEKLSRQRLTRAKNQLIEYSLLEIKQSNHHRFNYEWLVYDEFGKKLKHFNLGKFENKSIFEKAVVKNLSEDLQKNKAHFENESTKISTLSAVSFDTTEKNALYIETREKNLNKFIIIKNFKNLKIKNLKINKFLERKKIQRKERSQGATHELDFANAFLKINNEELETMAKKKFVEPSLDEVQSVIKAFNEEYKCALNAKLLAMRFVGYYKKDNGKWVMSNGKLLKDWKRALVNTWLMRELENWQRLSEWAKKRDLQRLENEEKRQSRMQDNTQKRKERLQRVIDELKSAKAKGEWEFKMAKQMHFHYYCLAEVQNALRGEEIIEAELIEHKGV